MSPTPLESVPALQAGVFANLERILSGYQHYELPDFSLRRFAPDTLHSISQPLRTNLPFDEALSFATVIAALGRVLGAYCGCQDLLFGIVDSQEDKLLPVRVAWSDNHTWEDVVASVAGVLSDPHSPRVDPHLLQLALGLSPKQSPVLALVSAGVLPHRIPDHRAPIIVVVDQAGVEFSITSPERAFHRSQTHLFASQVSALISHAVADPKYSFSLLPQLPSNILSSREKEKQHSEERVKGSYLVPSLAFATDYLTLRATDQPNGIAVRWYSDLSTDVSISSYIPETITNAGLEEKANQLGRWLVQIGLKKGRSVAVSMKRDIWFHIAFIGILRAGGCYVPIDADLPVERQQFIVKDADVQYILSTADMPCFSSLGEVVIDVTDRAVRDAIETQSVEILRVPRREDVSYILYTSGTTGTPKGCILTHEGLSEAIWALSQYCASAALSPHEKVNYLSIASVAFDVHIAEVMVALAVGIPILSAPRSLLLEDLPYYIKHLRISHVGIVPSLIEATMGLVEADEEAGNVTTLRYIASGGEKMSDAILDKWADHPKVRLANFYGPSEVTIGCAARMMDKDTPKANIGHPFANVAAYVVDESMNVILRGGSGELVVEGPLVGRGYVNRPDLTHKVFLKFPPDSTERWAYRTGDLVRMMADGTLEIIGRIDTQIKLRGVRIESEGISSIIRNAATPVYTLDVITVLARHPAIGIDQVVSFIAWDISVPVATRKGGKPCLAVTPPGLLQDLQRACDRELASYMRPSHIIALEFIPLSSNGKADAKTLTGLFVNLNIESLTALMSSERSSTGADDSPDDPTDTEKKVLEVLTSYIKFSVQHLGPRTNLFECGLDSLAIAQFAGDLRRAYSVTPSPVQIMQAPNVRGIAALLESGEPTILEDSSSSVDRFTTAMQEEVAVAYLPGSVTALLPPFPVQEGVLYRAANSPTMYVQHVLLQLAPDVSIPNLRDAWKKLVVETEMLRTVFHFGRALVQVVLRPEVCSIQVHENDTPLQDHSDFYFRRYFTDTQASSIARELNLAISTIPPVRLSFYTYTTSQAAHMVLSIHHALYDGISLPVLLQDLERVYANRPRLPSAPLRGILDNITFVDDDDPSAFWISYLKEFPWQTLLNRNASSSTADLVSCPFTRPLSELQRLAARQHVTLQALFMSVYGTLLSQYLYGHDDVVFGVIRAGRSIPVDDVENTICPMITVVPARVRLTDRSHTLQTVQRDFVRVSEYEHVPLGKIQKWIAECDGALFDTLFSVSYKEKGGSELWSVLESLNPEPDYILALEIVLDPEQDQAVVHAAFSSVDISHTIIDDILCNFEETAMHMVDVSGVDVLPFTCGAKFAASSVPTSSKILEDIDAVDHVDEDLVSRISATTSQFLRIPSSFVKPTTSLLSLGLDSIKSVGLSRRFLREGLDLSSVDIMRLSTPCRLAAFIERAKTTTREEPRLSEASFAAECRKLKEALDISTVKLCEQDDVHMFPTTILQAGMLSQTITSDGRLYVHLFPLRLARDIDIGRLRDSWSRVIASFDILRTSFHFLPGLGTWAQAVHSTPDFRWTESRHFTPTDFSPFATIDEQESFRRPPIFFNFIKATAADDAHRLVLVLHHALYDGLSITRLLDIVEEGYRGSEPTKFTQFHQLLPRLLWQEHNGTAFWVNRLRNLHHAPIPRRYPPSGDGTVHQISLLVQFTAEEILRACRDSEVTPQCLGQTAFAKLLSVLTGSRDVVFGRVVSGRDVPGAEGVIGPMLNTVPCRVILNEGVCNDALLKQVHDANVASMPWQHASLRSIQQHLRLPSLWDSLYVFQPRQESPESRVQGTLWVFDADEGNGHDISIQYPLNIELHEMEGGFLVKAACKSDVANTLEVQSLVERYGSILSDVVRRPAELWSNGLPYMPQAELSTTNRVASAVPEEPVSQEWDSRFDAFREVLSVTTKIPLSSICTSSYLAALGIDSITAVQIVAKTRRIGLCLTAAEVVQSKTVGHLLKRIREIKTPTINGVANMTVIDVLRSRWSALMPSHVVNDVERVVHASAGMEWMIGMWQRTRGSRFQHVFGYRLPADVDASRLENAWNTLVHRHAVLRSTFAYDSEAGTPRIVIFKPEVLAANWSQESLGSKDVLEAAENRMKELVSHSLEVGRPLARALFLRSAQAACLLLHLHHFQYDAWSLQLLVDDLSWIYAGEEPRSSNDLDGFLRFACPSAEAEEEQMGYWKSKSALCTPQLFPPLCKRSPGPDRIVYIEPTAVVGAAQLDQRARELAISLQSVFLACWAQVQARCAQAGNATFFLWHSGRIADLKDVERLAVPCINALPFSVLGARTDDTIALARRIQDDLKARSAVVEQTRLLKVHEWIGLRDRALSNVFVNIVKIAPDIEKKTNTFLEPLDVPYYIPEVSPGSTASIGGMAVTDLLRDDVMVEIIVMQEPDTVLMSIESAGTILDGDDAKKLLEEWGRLVMIALGEKA